MTSPDDRPKDPLPPVAKGDAPPDGTSGHLLRQRAEALLDATAPASPADLERPSPAAMQRIVHDLRVHQIELEMQNEELRWAQAELDASRSRYLELFELAPVGYFILSDNGMIVDVNLTAVAMLGGSRSALKRTPLSRAILPEDQDSFYLHLRQLAKTGTSSEWTLRMVRNDKATIWVRMNAAVAPVAEGADQVYRVATSEITAYKRLEQQKEALGEELYRQVAAAAAAHKSREAMARVAAASQEKANVILESVSVGVWEFHPISGELVFDDGMYGLYGLTRKEYPNPLEALKRAIHPDDQQRTLPAIWERIKLGESRLDVEFRVVRPDGAVRQMLAKMRVERDPDGVPVRIVGATSDLTELRHAELMRLQMVAAIDASAIVSVTDRDGKITSVNDTFCQISGYSRVELVGQDHRLLNSGLHSKAFYQEMWATIMAGRVWSGELQNRAKDGTLYWVQLTINPVRNADGKIESYLSVHFDVTELKESQLELVTTTKRLVDAQRLGQVGSYFIDFMNGVDEMSDEAKRIFGFAPEEPCDSAARLARLHPDDRPSFQKARDELIANGTPFDKECRIVLPDGTIRYAVIRLEGIRAPDGRVASVNGIIQDITASKKAELLERSHRELQANQERLRQATRLAELASATKSAFLANMSHEIRTPLGVMMGYAELITTPCAPEQKVSYAASIVHNGQILTALINDILDLSKVEAGKFTLDHRRLELAPFLNDVIEQLRVKSEEKGLALSLEFVGSLPETIVTDDGRLRQILINIVGNAIKFTERGGVKVQVALGRRGARPRLEIKVQDTGPGIAPEEQQKIFEPFTQGARDVAKKYGGTGLGVCLSSRLASALGGDLQLNASVVGQGSTFTISIDPGNLNDVAMVPMTAVRGAQQAKIIQDGANANKELAGIRVLLVEDSPDNQILVSRILGIYGAIVDVAANGDEGFKKVLSSAYDLVLMDLQMPVMSGYEATSMLRELGFTGPIVALTAHAMNEEVDRCLAMGFTGVLTKPINRFDLRNAVLQHTCGAAGQRKESSQVQMPPKKGFAAVLAAQLPKDVDTLWEKFSASDWRGIKDSAHQFSRTAKLIGDEVLCDVMTEIEHEAGRDKPSIVDVGAAIEKIQGWRRGFENDRRSLM